VTASQVEYMLWIIAMRRWDHRLSAWNRVLFQQTCHSLKPHNNKQTREKSQVVMKGIQLPVSNNATTGHKLKAAALTAYLSTLGFTKRIGLMRSRVRTHKGLYLRHPLDFDLRRYAVPPRLKEMLLSLRTDTACLLTLKMKTIRWNLHTLDSNN
jgi:hypothetical protein